MKEEIAGGGQQPTRLLISPSKDVRRIREAAIPSLLELRIPEPRTAHGSAQGDVEWRQQGPILPNRRVRGGKKKRLAILNAQRLRFR